MIYQPQHTALMKQIGKIQEELPEGIQTLIVRFNAALASLDKAGAVNRKKLLPVIAQSDAVIASRIFQEYGIDIDQEKARKLRILELEAKARLLNRKTT